MSNPAPMTSSKPKPTSAKPANGTTPPATEKDVREALKTLHAEYKKKMAPLRAAVKEAKKLASEYKPRFAPLRETLKAMRSARAAAQPKVGDRVEIVNEKKKAYFGKVGRVEFARGRFVLVAFAMPEGEKNERDFRVSELKIVTPAA